MSIEHNQKKSALVVGAMGGLATATTNLLTKNGWEVFAADISEEIFNAYNSNESVISVLMDITNDESVENAFNLISGKTDKLDAIINMAGVLKIGSMIELPVHDLQTALDINLYGTYRVNKEFFPLLFPVKGRIINLSSEVGWQSSAPFNGLYSLSKHALEAYSDALRRELAFLDIKVIKIQPGPFKTNMTKSAEFLFAEAENNSLLFKKNLEKGSSYLPKVYENANNPDLVAKVILKAITSSNPKITYSVRPDISRLILNLLPHKWVDRILKKVLS